VRSVPASEPERSLLVLDASALVELVIEGAHRAGADEVLANRGHSPVRGLTCPHRVRDAWCDFSAAADQV
jgi:D-aminopeptidase